MLLIFQAGDGDHLAQDYEDYEDEHREEESKPQMRQPRFFFKDNLIISFWKRVSNAIAMLCNKIILTRITELFSWPKTVLAV